MRVGSTFTGVGGIDLGLERAGHTMGFPDGWTIPEGPSLRDAPIWFELDRPDPDPPEPKPDGPRYAQMGNAVTVTVAEWIGRRLMEYA